MKGIDVRIFLINTSEEVLGHSFACIYWKYLNYSLNYYFANDFKHFMLISKAALVAQFIINNAVFAFFAIKLNTSYAAFLVF